MTLRTLQRESFQRVVLAAVVIVDLLSFFMFLDEARASPLARGVELSAFVDWGSQPIVCGLVIVIGIAGAALFARSPGRLWAGLFPLGALTLLSTVHAQLFGSPWRHLYYSGLCLSGWLLGLAVSRWRGRPTDESYARIGSTALLGAAYLNAGISKLAFGGWDWALGLPIQAVVVAQDGMVADSIVSTYRSWVVASPTVAGLCSSATILFELLGPLLIGGLPLRVCVALGLLAMHLNILILTHILYWESMVFLVLFGLLARSEAVRESAAAVVISARSFIATTAVLVLAASIGVVHQGRRFAKWQERTPMGSQAVAREGVSRQEPAPNVAPISAVPPSAVSLRQVGPLVVGQMLVEGWTVDALEITEGGFVAVFVGKPGRAKFEITCAPSEHRSPFDVGRTHIFYSKDVAFGDLETVGWALRGQIRNAGEGQALCDRLADWQNEARASQSH